MRMGRPNKKRRSNSSKKKENPKPKRSSPNLVVGQVSSNIIASSISPRLSELALKGLETYAEDLVSYQDALSAAEKENGGDTEAEVNLDGDVVNETLSPPKKPSSNRLFTTQFSVDEFNTQVLSSTARHFSTTTNQWKVHANAAKFERLLDEKYGPFRPFITDHPEIETFIKNVQRRYAMGGFSPFRPSGDAPFSKSTSIILLFMMQRNGVRWDGLLLAAVFLLVGLQPWALVVLVAVGHEYLERRKKKSIGGMPKKIQTVDSYYDRDIVSGENAADEDDESEEAERERKFKFLSQKVGTNIKEKDLTEEEQKGLYDTLILGTGPSALYTASLLSRSGKKVLVISENEDASGCHSITSKLGSGIDMTNIPFDVEGNNVSHVSRQQQLLAPALCTTTDVQGGIRFAKIGSPTDDYTHTILSIPGVGVDGANGSYSIPFLFRGGNGARAVADEAASRLGDGWPADDGTDGNSASASYLSACQAINTTAGKYYLTKILPESSKSFQGGSSYQEASIRYASSFLNKCLPLNAQVRSLVAGMGLYQEDLPPAKASMAVHVSNVNALISPEGMSYPVGGPRALCHALASVVEQNGGRVLTGARWKEFVFDDTKNKESGKKKKKKEEEEDGGPKPHCVGIQLDDGRSVTVSSKGGSVISMLGMINTFVHKLPDDIRSQHGVPRGLPALTERRPLLRFIIGLSGTKDELSLTGADWYRVPNATVARDEIDPVTGQIKLGEIGYPSDNSVSTGEEEENDEDKPSDDIDAINSTADPDGGRGKRKKTGTSEQKPRRTKFQTGQSWIKVSFPSAKDPSWEDRHGKISTCVVTIEADDDFVRLFETKPKIYSMIKSGSGEAKRLMERVMKDLLENFPQLEGKIMVAEVVGPTGGTLSHNPERFAARGVRADTPYPGLYIGGSDLTVGESFSGSIVGSWLAANAVMGYGNIDHLYLGKNVTSDLQQFLEEPFLSKERNGVVVEDLAVPLKESIVPVAESPAEDAKEDEKIKKEDETVAEKSKEQ
uniref:Uncharacterized protein n=1 Tax=Ditylum brightwellii TaxID=49249 RepID=A0A7S4RCC2_9STRA